MYIEINYTFQQQKLMNKYWQRFLKIATGKVKSGPRYWNPDTVIYVNDAYAKLKNICPKIISQKRS